MSNQTDIFKLPNSFQTELTVGGSSQYQTVPDAIRAIPPNAGNVLLYLNRGVTLTESIQLPAEKGITSLTIDSITPVTIQCDEGKLFAWGIPVVIGENITLSQLTIFGGGYAINGEKDFLERSTLVVYGTVGNLFGGGYALDQSEFSVNQADIAVYGKVQYEMYGGGYSVGKDSYTFVKFANIYVDERAEIGEDVYYGGFAATRCIDVGPTKKITDLFGKYEIIDQDCGRDGGKVSVKQVTANISGRVKGNLYAQNRIMSGAHGVKRISNFSTEPIANPPGLIQGYGIRVIQKMRIAPGEQCDTLLCAMENINKDTTDLNIILTHNATEDYSVMIPYSGYSLERVTVNADKPVKISFGGRNFFANGIDFTLGENVYFSEVQLYAGTSSLAGKFESINKASVTIHGMVDDIYGGSMVNNDGSSAEILSSKILITGSVQKNVYGGGYASGKNTQSIVDDVTITLGKDGIIRGNLIYGGNAQNYCLPNGKGGQDCKYGGYTYTDTVFAAIYGKVIGNILADGISAEGAHSDFGKVQYILADDENLMNLVNPQIIRVGQYEEIKTIQKALQSIHYPGNDVVIVISSNLDVNEMIEIPRDFGFSSVTIESDRMGVNRSINFHGKDFFANGIPLTIGENIVLLDSSLYGGSRETFGSERIIEYVELNIAGYADTIFLGGKAEGSVGEVASSSQIETGVINLSGTITGSLYAGGNAIGGGLAEIGSAEINILPTGRVNIAVYSYGKASSSVNQALDMTTKRCFSSLQDCERYAGRSDCQRGYSYGGFITTSSYEGFSIGYYGNMQYCVQLDMSLKNNKSLSMTGTVHLNIEGTVPGRINCSGKLESDGGKATVDTVIPSELCSPE